MKIRRLKRVINLLNEGCSMSSENVYGIVHESLNKTSPHLAAQWMSKYPPAAASTVGINVQISNVNAYWRIRLGSLSVNTVEARSCLVDSLPLSTWRKDFVKYVIPVIVGNIATI